MSVLLEMTQSFIEMIDTDMSKKGSIRKKDTIGVSGVLYRLSPRKR